MMLYAPIEPGGGFYGRHDTLGVDDEAEARDIVRAFNSGRPNPRLAVVQENMRAAIEMLESAEPMGRG